MEFKKCPLCGGVIERYESETCESYVCACCEAIFDIQYKRSDTGEDNQ